MKWSFMIFSLVTCATSLAQKLTYEDHVLPILENSCTNCHNPDKKKGDLDLTTYRGLMAGSSGGQIVVAGDGGGSKIFTTSAHTVEPFMPPKGDRLGNKEINLIRAWIDGGLLETMDSKAKKSNAPKIDFSGIDTNKPSGPPPVPEALNTDPVIVPERAGFVADIEASPWAPVIAMTSQRQVLLYNTDTADLIGVLPFPNKKGNPESLSFHSSGKYLLAGGGIQGKSGTTATWDILTGKLIMQTGREYDSVIAASLRADLKAVATSGPSRLIKMWLTVDNSLENNIKKHTDWVTSLSYSHDGVLLASADRNGGIYIWEAETGNPFHNLRGHTDQIVALKWSPDSNYLASASEDGQVRVWDMNSGKEIKKIDAHNSGVLDMDWSKKGKLITAGRDGMIKVWKADYNLLKQIKYEGSMPTKVEWTYDGAKFITVDFAGNVSVWNSQTYKLEFELLANPLPLASRIVAVEKNLREEQKIAHHKKMVVNQKNQQKYAHQKQINDARLAHKSSTDLVDKFTNETNRHQQKIKQLSEQEKVLQMQLSKMNTQRSGLANNMKLFHSKLVMLDRDLRASNQQVAKFKKEIHDLNQKVIQSNNLVEKEPENKAKEKLLKELQAKLAALQAELKNYQVQEAEISKQKKVLHLEVNKLEKEQQMLELSMKLQGKKKDSIIHEKKSLWETIKKNQIEITNHRKTAFQKKREEQELQQKLAPVIKDEQKALLEFENFYKTLMPLQKKLERLKARVKP